MKLTLGALSVSVIAFVGCGQMDGQSTLEQDTAQMALDGTAAAAPTPGHEGRRGRRGPPAEALAACTGKAVDAACAFTHRERALDGACRALPDDAATLVCRPFPPAELVAACEGLAADAACTITRPDGGTATGQCRAPRFEAAPILCMPDHPRGRGHRGSGGGDCHHADGGTRPAR